MMGTKRNGSIVVIWVYFALDMIPVYSFNAVQLGIQIESKRRKCVSPSFFAEHKRGMIFAHPSFIVG